MDSRRLPNFFIVGAPKCGTTAFSELLRKHPNLFLTDPKEPRYFARHLTIVSPGTPEYVTSFEAYLELYRDVAPDVHSAIGEASTSYLRSERALREIADFRPRSRIIVFIRNPVDLAYSWHSQKVIEGQEDESNFEKAWALQEERRNQSPPRRLRQRDSLEYAMVAGIGTQLETLYGIFPAEQILVIFQENISDDGARTYRRVIEFLGLELDENRSPERIRESVDLKWPRLWRFFNNRSRSTDVLVRFVKRILGSRATRIADGWRSHGVQPRKALNEEMRLTLIDFFQSEVDKIEVITGRRLDHWRV